MRIPRLYTDQRLAPNDLITLDHDASKYLTRVLRMQTGHQLVLFNGDGYNYGAVISNVAKATAVTVTSCQPNPSESPLKITLVQSLGKGAKLDLVIQKATELGAHRISPISNERSVRRIPQDRTSRKLDHWRNIAISACAQCNRSTIPIIDPLADFNDWLTALDSDNVYLLHPEATHSFADIELTSPDCTLLVGPEGGFSDEEITQATATGITPLRCGPRILRTETAGFAAISILQARFGDLH